MLGSNQRRLSRRFYSPSLLAEANDTGLRVRGLRRYRGVRAVRYVSVRWESGAALGADTHGRRPWILRLHALGRLFYPLTCHLSGCLFAVAVCLVVRLGPGVRSTEGVGNPPVGSVGLAPERAWRTWSRRRHRNRRSIR